MAAAAAHGEAAAAAIEASLAPLLAEYDRAADAVVASQAGITAKLDAVLAELARVQRNAPVDSVLGDYANKVTDLRKRMDAVAYTMKRVHVRLDSLQTAVARHEQLAAQKRKSDAAAAAVAAAVASS